MKVFLLSVCSLLALGAVSWAEEMAVVNVASKTIVDTSCVIPKAGDAAVVLPSHMYLLDVNPPDSIWLDVVSSTKGDELKELERYYGVTGICSIGGCLGLGYGWCDFDGMTLGRDSLSQTHDGKGGVSSSFSKDAARCCGYEDYIEMSTEELSDILSTPLIQMEGEGWSISYANSWREYLLKPTDVKNALNKDGQLIQELELRSPQGECITLQFALAYKDGDEQLYVLSWSPRGSYIDWYCKERGLWRVENPKGENQLEPLQDATKRDNLFDESVGAGDIVAEEPKSLIIRYPERVVRKGGSFYSFYACNSFQPEPISYTEDHYTMDSPAGMNRVVAFEKYIIRKSGREQELLAMMKESDARYDATVEKANSVKAPPFFRFKAKGWRLEDDSRWVHLYQIDDKEKILTPSELRHPNGRIEQKMTLISPQGEHITLRFTHALIDKQGHEWSPAWGISRD